MVSVVYRRPYPSRPLIRRFFSLLLMVGLVSLCSYLILEIRW